MYELATAAESLIALVVPYRDRLDGRVAVSLNRRVALTWYDLAIQMVAGSFEPDWRVEGGLRAVG